MSSLVLENVYKKFGETEVLKGINLDVADHEVVCLIGASGSGKSTLLRCVNLIEGVTSGRIIVGGQEVTAPGVDVNRLRREIGIVYQSFNLFPHMSVIENVSLAPRKVLKLSKRRRPGRSDRAARPVSAWPTRPMPTPTTCPAASSSGWRSCGRWR